jgi:hypothetical protein
VIPASPARSSSRPIIGGRSSGGIINALSCAPAPVTSAGISGRAPVTSAGVSGRAPVTSAGVSGTVSGSGLAGGAPRAHDSRVAAVAAPMMAEKSVRVEKGRALAS